MSSLTVPPKTIPFTEEKYRQMQEKVAELESLRKEVMERLVTAREMGDLSENGAYKYAKFELGNIGRQLRQLNRLLLEGYPESKQQSAETIIGFGSIVTLQKESTTSQSKPLTITLVSKHESNIVEGKMSDTSPIGKAVKGKSVGDRVSVTTPREVVDYTILDVM